MLHYCEDDDDSNYGSTYPSFLRSPERGNIALRWSANICFDSRTCAQKFAGEQTRVKHFADASKRGVVFALKLRFDSGLVYDRPRFLPQSSDDAEILQLGPKS
jgi:hypothetical protein